MEHPFLDHSFHIPWSKLTPEHVEPDICTALEEARQGVEAVASQDRGRLSFESTLLAFEAAVERLREAWAKVGHLDSVCNSPALRKAYNAMLPAVSDFFTRLYLNEPLWEVLRAYAQTSEAEGLTGVRRRFLEEMLEDFREAGAELAAAQKERLAQVNAELAQLTQKYSENVLDATNAWELFMEDPQRLAGLPERAREAARLDALRHGQGTPQEPRWRFSLHEPSIVPALTYLEDRELREEIWRASNAVGACAPHDNSALIWKILALRHEKATLLGQAQFADYVTRRRMAGSGEAALEFIHDLHQRVYPAFRDEVIELKQFRETHGGGEPGSIEPWDFAFWSERQRRERYAFDAEQLRPYFPIGRVIEGLFTLAQQVFGVSIVERPDVEGWHEEVRYYDMRDTDGRHMGSFYADWHPRASKRGGAWMNHLKTGGWNADGEWEPHLGLICGNLTPSLDGKPALLNHREVETIFHEFGHLLHHLCGEVEVRSLSGINVVWDFVELPSQFMENWCWERASLDLFARHFETDEPIPQELFDKMRAARQYQCAAATMRQLSLGKLDLELHLNYARHKDKDLDALLDELLADYRVRFHSASPTTVRRFTHLFADATGYAAGYYSYKWAEVLDADAFSRFLDEGVLNPEVGREFRQRILSRGNSAPAEVLFRDFMGRDPDLNALLVRSGIVKH